MSVYTQFYSLHTVKRKMFSGSIPLSSVLAAGDFGIGTFNKINGEMVAVDGVIYRTKSDGTAEAVNDGEEKTPYSIMTHFKADKTKYIDNMPLELVEKEIDILRAHSERDIFAINIVGDFSWVRSRAPDITDPPYKDLGALIADQPSSTVENVSGNIVGFYTPEYLGALGVPGYHLHFIDKERKRGGHMQDLFVKSAAIEIQKMDEIRVHSPGGDDQEALKLSGLA